MKFTNMIRVLFFVGAILYIPHLVTAKESIRMCLLEAPPLMTKTMENYGCQAAIVTEAFKCAGVEVEYFFVEPAGAIERAKRGVNFDALVGWVWSQEREKFFYYSDPIFKAPLVFFHLKTFPFSWEAYDDLEGIPIGTINKNFYGTEFHKAQNAGKLEVQEVPQIKLNFDKLLYKRISLFPYNLFCGYYYIQKEYNPQKAGLFVHNPKPLKTSVYHVLFSKKIKKNKLLVELFNKGLFQIKQNGMYDELIKECLME